MYSEAGKKMPYLLYNGLASDKSKRVETQTRKPSEGGKGKNVVKAKKVYSYGTRNHVIYP